MPDNTQQSEQPKQFVFEIVEPREGVFRTYAQVSYVHWSGMDMTFNVYQMIQPNREIGPKDAPNKLLHTAAITLSWNSAKIFHGLLGQVLERYEKANGPIKTDFTQI
jgi:Protein of unknown function (DUF3467)